MGGNTENGQRLFRMLIDQSRDSIEVIDPQTLRVVDINAGACEALGYTREELLTRTVADYDPLVATHGAGERLRELDKVGHAQFETVHRRRDGSEFPVEVSVRLIDIDRPYLVAVARDITERKRHEQALARSNRILKALSRGDAALVHATTDAELYTAMTTAIVEGGGYRMAWVGLAETDEGLPVRAVAKAGDVSGYVERANISWADVGRGDDPIGRCIRSGEVQIVSNIGSDPRMAPCRAAMADAGFLSAAVLPLQDGGATFGALSIYADEADAFGADDIALLKEMAGDLSFGIVNLRVRAEHERAVERLERSMEGTVRALAGTVELRDPYTAGHQQRVARLAVAIGGTLGLEANRLRGLELAASIHDIGKLIVPAEILSKPGRITPVEYELIKSHAAAGAEILKGVEFPWPVSETILEHHERMDGSGYPRGLKGDEILLEARILAVADVIESMASHRPYRSARGVEAALGEILQGRGSKFDERVVDACVELIRKGGWPDVAQGKTKGGGLAQ